MILPLELTRRKGKEKIGKERKGKGTRGKERKSKKNIVLWFLLNTSIAALAILVLNNVKTKTFLIHDSLPFYSSINTTTQTLAPTPTPTPAITLDRKKMEFLASLSVMKQHGRFMLGKHDLGSVLKRSNESDLLYIFVPKAASTTIKQLLAREAQEKNWRMAMNVHIQKLNTSKSTLLFSVIRHPYDRIASAYSTLTSRTKGRAGMCKDTKFDIIAPHPPQKTSNIQEWEEHFRQSVTTWLEGVIQSGGFKNKSCEWDVHFAPQIEFLKGYPVRHIGCTQTLSTTFDFLNITTKSSPMANAYQNTNGILPKQKFQSHALLSNYTKELIDRVYEEDFWLFNTFCNQ